MNESLEQLVQVAPEKSLSSELRESMRNYPRTLLSYTKSILPAAAVSATGSALAQWSAQKMGYESATAATVAGYLGGYIPGYATFFGLEFKKNREKYPKFFSKEFGKFVSTFLAADYIADLAVFSPTLIATNVALVNNTDMHPFPRGLTSWAVATVPYLLVISGLHPVVRRVNETVNNGIKKLYHSVTGKSKVQ